MRGSQRQQEQLATGPPRGLIDETPENGWGDRKRSRVLYPVGNAKLSGSRAALSMLQHPQHGRFLGAHSLATIPAADSLPALVSLDDGRVDVAPDGRRWACCPSFGGGFGG